MPSEPATQVSELTEQLAKLRKNYVRAYPRQRLHIAAQRIANPEHDPNRLIAYVAAIEGFARSLCMHAQPRARARIDEIYPKYKRRGAVSLVGEYLRTKGLGKPREFFGEDTWHLFEVSVEYRNLLAHECTYLGVNLSPKLIESCRTVLRKLADAAGLDPYDI